MSLAGAAFHVHAQDTGPSADGPVLTDLQRLQITTLLQAIELAQLRAQLAQKDFDTAQQQLADLARRLERPGYEIDLQTLTYRPVARIAPRKEP